MVAVKENSQKRLTIQTVEIAPNTTAIRSLDWDRDRFDIEFGLQNGTTYNSYLIKDEKIALFDTRNRPQWFGGRCSPDSSQSYRVSF